MKHIIILLLSLSYINCYSQIKVITKKDNKNMKPIISESYDSLTNFANNLKVLKGQTLHIIPLTEKSKKYGYANFNKKNNGVLKLNYDKTPYDSLINKSFYVNDYVIYQKIISNGELINEIYYLELINKQNNDTIYYRADFSSESDFPFIIDGYHKKLLKQFKGKKTVSRENTSVDDINNNKISMYSGEIWEIEDFVLEDNSNFHGFYTLSIVFKNNKGTLVSSIYQKDFLMEKLAFFNESQRIRKKYGEKSYLNGLKGSVFVGMNKELAKFSWGTPNSINKTTSNGTREQWVYGDGNYLYFVNGKLSAIQN